MTPAAAGAAATTDPAPPTPATAIAADRLMLAHGRLPVVKDLTLQVPVSARVALLGSNGSGKSTLLAALAALRAPRGGTLSVLGHRLPDARWAVRGQVGLLAHQPLLYRDLTIRENLRHHAGLLGLPGERVEELIAQTELQARADQPVGALSRGLTQRAAVARALLADPPLLLLDEPLANLDPVAAGIVGGLLAAPASGGPRTTVTASHDPERALADATHAIVLGPRAQVRFAGAAAGLTAADVEGMYR